MRFLASALRELQVVRSRRLLCQDSQATSPEQSITSITYSRSRDRGARRVFCAAVAVRNNSENKADRQVDTPARRLMHNNH